MHDLIGCTLGHYRIVEKIGEGGMGEVYRAHDERLDRDVAIKVLPEKVAGVQDRLERFEREAKLLASLNHPNIATLHGLEEEGGHRFLVMELVEGESLAGVISRGPVPIDDALTIALQITEALEAAHGQGIIHRDLKPANVMMNPEGGVKVLDFGLAKAFDPEGSGPQSAELLSESPTLTADLTRGGVLLGTAAYMSPEQASGKAVDKRADIWAFGCVVFEMLTGTRTFPGATSTEILAGIIKEEPDWDELPDDTPPPVRKLLQRCLTKNPRDRLHDIADARIEIQFQPYDSDVPAAVAIAPRSLGGRRIWLALSLAAAIGFATGYILNSRSQETNAESDAVIRFEDVVPKDQGFHHFGYHSIVLSPDGKHLVYSANRRLYLRSLDRVESSAIRGTEVFTTHMPPRSLFFSPDSEQVGFWADGKLRRINIGGGTAVPICDTLDPVGVHWGAEDRVLFGQGANGIWSVNANGGTPRQVISVDPEKVEYAHVPQMLPDGDHVLFTLITGQDMGNSEIVVQSQKTGKRHVLISGGTDGRFIDTGHIVYVQRSTLFAAAFDSEKNELAGQPVAMVNDIQAGIDPRGSGVLSVSKTGTLAYMTRTNESRQSRLVWVDRNGAVTSVLDDTKDFGYLKLSPDDKRAAVTISDGIFKEIWVIDLVENRLSFPIRRGGCSWDPVWTPDGRHIIFSYEGAANTTADLYKISVDGSDFDPELIHDQPGQQYPYSISANGERLFFIDYGNGEKRDLWVLDLTGQADPRPLLDSSFNELHATVSPNNRWLAYSSDRTGRFEVWVASYPDLESRRPVSANGGYEPRWSRDGLALFYRAADRMMEVAVTIDEPEFRFETPRVLFEGKFWGYPAWPSYGVTADGRFLMIQPTDLSTWGADSRRLFFVVNWFEELKRLAPKD